MSKSSKMTFLIWQTPCAIFGSLVIQISIEYILGQTQLEGLFEISVIVSCELHPPTSSLEKISCITVCFHLYLKLFFRQIEGKVIEISQLQEIFSEKVLDQVMEWFCSY